MQLIVKNFDELTTRELYEIYKVRFDVFVVEQQCCYQDADEFDPMSIHMWLQDEEGIVAYLRVLPPNTVFDVPSLGRVLSVKRRMGFGTQIVKEGIKVAKERFGADIIKIEAQTYVRKMYEDIGFVQSSEEFLDVGIPHINMQLIIGE